MTTKIKTELDKKIRAFEKERKDDKEPIFAKTKSSGAAGRAGYEFLIATLFFAGIGFAIDYQLDTTPWVTLSLFFVGFATGVYNAWRSMNVSGEKVGLKYKTVPKSELGFMEMSAKNNATDDDEDK
jgi:F0F1-type ATP synthase assembly protein I